MGHQESGHEIPQHDTKEFGSNAVLPRYLSGHLSVNTYPASISLSSGKSSS